MKRTISLKLSLTNEQSEKLAQTQTAFANACNQIVPYAADNRCWNRVALHHLCYYLVRKKVPEIGSQMICNALRKVCSSYKTLKPKKSKEVPHIHYREKASVHTCKRTYSLRESTLSLFTISGRITISFQLGEHQQRYLSQGTPKEAELIRRGKEWTFNLVLEIPTPPSLVKEPKVLAVDVGENNLAVTSSGKGLVASSGRTDLHSCRQELDFDALCQSV